MTSVVGVSMIITSVGSLLASVVPDEGEDASLAMAAVLGVSGVALLIAAATSIVGFCMWINRAAWNVRALGHSHFEITPGWAAGWFFVPLLNLWKPLHAMQEIWQASNSKENSPGAWLSVARSELVKVWWVAWVVGNALARVGGKPSRKQSTWSPV
jgi:hypothetical protein